MENQFQEPGKDFNYQEGDQLLIGKLTTEKAETKTVVKVKRYPDGQPRTLFLQEGGLVLCLKRNGGQQCYIYSGPDSENRTNKLYPVQVLPVNNAAA